MPARRWLHPRRAHWLGVILTRGFCAAPPGVPTEFLRICPISRYCHPALRAEISRRYLRRAEREQKTKGRDSIRQEQRLQEFPLHGKAPPGMAWDAEPKKLCQIKAWGSWQLPPKLIPMIFRVYLSKTRKKKKHQEFYLQIETP